MEKWGRKVEFKFKEPVRHSQVHDKSNERDSNIRRHLRRNNGLCSNCTQTFNNAPSSLKIFVSLAVIVTVLLVIAGIIAIVLTRSKEQITTTSPYINVTNFPSPISSNIYPMYTIGSTSTTSSFILTTLITSITSTSNTTSTITTSVTTASTTTTSGDCYATSCRSDWVLNSDTHHCYYQSTTTKTWYDAQMDCLTLGGNMTQLESYDEKEWAWLDLPAVTVFIGLKRADSSSPFMWNDGTTFNISIYNVTSPYSSNAQWCPGHPLSTENYVAYNADFAFDCFETRSPTIPILYYCEACN